MTSRLNGCPYFSSLFFSSFILKLIATCRLCVIYVREDGDSNAYVMITRLMCGKIDHDVLCPEKAVKRNHSITHPDCWQHYCSDVIMGAMASQITSLTIVYLAVYSGTDQRKHQSSASLAFVRGIHRWPLNSPQKLPIMRKMLPFDDVIITAVSHSENTLENRC